MSNNFMADRTRIAVAGLTVCVAFGLAAPARGQSFQRLSPKTPQKETPAKPEVAPVALPAGAANPAAPKLKGVVIVSTRAEVQAKGDVAVSGLKVGPGSELDLLRQADFEQLVAGYVGQPVDELHLNRLQSDLILYYRKSGHPLVDVVYPEQESVGSGVVQIFVLEAKLGQVVVEGNKYYGTNVFVGEIRLRPGEAVDTRRLNEDIDWLNQNPGRSVDAAFKPGAALGSSDLVLRVQDRFPVRGYVGYENSGPRVAGENRLLAGFNWFDAFGLDQRFGYQYTTDTDFKFIRAHSATYDIPLPWRHTLSFYGGYVDSEADFGNNAGPVRLRGSSFQVSGRYQLQLPRIGSYTHDLALGLDLKQFNNNFEFGGVTLAATKADIFQTVALYRGALPDPYGRTTWGLEGYWSPGGVTDNNKDATFAALRNNSKANYVYGKATLQRETPLPGGFAWVLRGMGQLADGNLQSSEQIGLGGYSTVRGYREREANGDSGIYASSELYTPAWGLLELMGAGVKDRFQLLGFFDYGATRLKQPLPGEQQHADLMSVGAGLRYSVRQNLSVRFDWGWQLKASGDPSGRNDQAHVAVVLSY